MITPASDRVEIREIKSGERMEGKKGFDHREGLGRIDQPRARKGMVTIAFARTGMDHEPCHEIDHGNDGEGRHAQAP